MTKRGYRTMNSVMEKIASLNTEELTFPAWETVYSNWHDDRYFKQCYYNLQEKYDCGGISPYDWHEINQIAIDKYGYGELL